MFYPSNPRSFRLLTRHVLSHRSSRRRAAINPISYTSLCFRKLHATTDEVQPHLTCNTAVQSSWCGRRFRKLCQRPSLEPCHDPVLPNPLWDFPHLLLLSLFLLLEFIQHSLETGLQRQTCHTTVNNAFSTEWVLPQHVKWCSKPQAALTTSPLISCSFMDCFASIGKCWSMCVVTPQLFLTQQAKALGFSRAAAESVCWIECQAKAKQKT